MSPTPEDPRWLAHPTLLLGRDPVVVGFADHEIREYGVGSGPGGGDIRRPMLAQAALKRPQQRLAHRCIVGCLDAVSDVAFGEPLAAGNTASKLLSPLITTVSIAINFCPALS